ncbi:MAG: hypothetical protein AB1846_17610 [Chloroflexota bacterium]
MSNTDSPLAIRFEGQRLGRTGMPINDLGQSFITIQRMVHIAYLIGSGRPFVRATVRDDERQALALHIASHERGSDVYLLDWFVREVIPGVPANLIADVILLLAGATVAYAKCTIGEKLKGLRLRDLENRNQQVDLLAVRMYNEMQDLVNQLGPEVDSISIKFIGHKTPVVIDQKVKDYVNSLEGTQVPGRRDDYIVGSVDKAHTIARNCVEVLMERPQTKRKKLIKVCMPGPMFEDLLTELTDPAKNRFGFTGQAHYTIGRSLNWYNEFEATSFQPAM